MAVDLAVPGFGRTSIVDRFSCFAFPAGGPFPGCLKVVHSPELFGRPMQDRDLALVRDFFELLRLVGRLLDRDRDRDRPRPAEAFSRL